MNAPALPAYLQNRQKRNLAEAATAGLGSSLPAHISTEGSVFTLIDAAGNEQRLTFTAQDGKQYQQPYLDACVIDINAGTSKRYYGGKKWKPGANDAPVCWSAGGVVPNRESSQMQARTCAECEWNRRGSATSEKSGASIKACRDEKWLALVIPQIQMDTIFRYVVTPGSFGNWKDYIAMFKNSAVEISDIITRLEFDPDEPNTIKFSSIGQYVDERTARLTDQALAVKATDIFVGRDLESGAPALAAPAAQAALPPTQPSTPRPFEATAPQSGLPAAGAIPASNGTAPMPQSAPVAAPAPGRRRRNATQQAPAVPQQAPAAPFPTSAAPVSPFPANPAPSTVAPTGVPNGSSNFGIQAGVAPDPALSATLQSIFPGQK